MKKKFVGRRIWNPYTRFDKLGEERLTNVRSEGGNGQQRGKLVTGHAWSSCDCKVKPEQEPELGVKPAARRVLVKHVQAHSLPSMLYEPLAVSVVSAA